MSRDAELVLVSGRVVLPGGVRPASVFVRGGKIERVGRPEEAAGPGVVDAGDLALLPGLVDTHVHCNEPGRTEWEGFETATRAAAAGGVTTLVDMPLNSVPATTTAAALAAKREAAAGKCRVDVGFWGGVVPGNRADLAPLWEAGALGFKCFLVDSGVPEFPATGEGDLAAALETLARLGAPLLAHCELPAPIERARARLAGADPRRHATWLSSRPPEAEVEAIELLLAGACRTGARVHVVHLSAAAGLAPLEAARRAGAQVTVETCPHYLVLAAEEAPDGDTRWKCAPPVREEANREALWDALARSAIQLVVSDHSPCPPALKRLEEGDFLAAWGGIASLELGLSLVWTEAARRGIGLEPVAEWMCLAPARLAGLEARKGAIEVGRDADLVLFDPEALWRVEPSALAQRHGITPYAGRELAGRVETVWLRGEVACDRRRFPTRPAGRLLEREGAGR